MKSKSIFIMIAAVVVFCLGISTPCAAYSIMLPELPCTPALPYTASADHYNGAACIQMALNACPTVASRHYNNQADIYARILAHNTEITTWFSDPNGIKGTMMDPLLSPCGHWVDYSNTNKTYVLGKMLYWMKAMKYLVPVSIGSSEHWVIVMGYHTDVEPTSSSSTVTLQNIFLYDPTPGLANASVWVTGTVWLNSADYWGVPHNKPGSAWHNKYLAIIEPPSFNLNIRVPRWVLEGPIRPPEYILSSAERWFGQVREARMAVGPFEVLNEREIRFEKPILVDAGRYKYYLVPFNNGNISAIFNAYSGEFEELRVSKEKQTFVLEPRLVTDKLRGTFEKYRLRDVRIMEPQFLYNEKLAQAGRFSPTWSVQAEIRDARGRRQRLDITLNSAGEVIKGLDKIKKYIRPIIQ